MNTHFMFPNEARLRNMTYGITIYYDMTIEFLLRDEKGGVIKNTLNFPNILLGKMPIMLQSSLCALSGLDRDLRF